MSLDPSTPAEGGATGLRTVVAWHLGWAVATTLLAAATVWLWSGVEVSVVTGVAVMIIPGLAGVALLRGDGPGPRALLLGVWALATVSSSALSGGLSGSLAGFAFMPLIVGILLGGRSLAIAGAGAVALTALIGLGSLLLSGPAAEFAGLAAASTVLAALAAGVAVSARASGGSDAAAQASAPEANDAIQYLLSGQPALTLVIERTGRVLGAYGHPPPAVDVEALYEQGLIAAIHAPDRAGVRAAMDQALAGADGQAVFAPRTALDRRVSLVVRRLDDAGETPRLIAQAFDGTAQFAREAGLETARVEAEAQNAGKSRFLANMSHELRTPLNAVLGFSDIMRQRLFGPLPDKYADYAESIHQAGGHLLDLINDVLDMSKIEAERYELSLERLDAREVVSAAIALVRLSANDKGVELASVLPNEPLSVDADRRALKQISLNLLSNAIKFTPGGGSVTVTLDAIGPYLEIVVADTGVGIAPEDLRRLGRPFEQAGANAQRAQGTGLGLSLVRALAELHGGRMTIDSTLGEGAAVTVRLPVVALVRPAVPEGGAEVIALRPVEEVG
ncbi:sensor histidine kinase [Brevundimonas sp.]|uniref:sensor histidine kinase n=1 Tax=Brevundimonas sp. TaxID=1871086 RepID=UPI003BA90EC2